MYVRKQIWAAAPALALLLAGCATPAFDHRGAQTGVAPWEAVEQSLDDIDVIWGGVTLKVHHVDGQSEIEVLAYPLDRGQRPIPGAPSQGRFRIRLPGYVESVDFPEGLFLTARGHLVGNRQGDVDGVAYVYPIIASAQIHRWPPGYQFDQRHWSVGVGVGVLL